VAAILLAAGNSERMGRPKPLLEWRGQVFLDLQVKLFRQCGCAVHVVLGRDAAPIAAACPTASCSMLLLNPEPDRGMLSSLQIGLAALPATAPAVLFTPVDNPGVRPETLRAILSTWSESRAPLVIPRFGSRRGHPVLLDRSLIQPLLSWPASSTPRDFIHQHIDHAAFADLDDPLITVDIDTPDDYQSFLLREPAP
jgi:CTP:molybdopterin cytidylyltransferase MocA